MTNTTNTTKNEDNCGSCKHWTQIELTEKEEHLKAFGKCRRNPPAMLVQEGTTYSGHPIVPSDEYCAEFKPKGN
jgi:hypothetical protein